MNLRDNKGYVGMDAALAIAVMVIIVPAIMGIILNINITKNVTRIKTSAIDIAVNTIEAAKGTTLQNNTAFRNEAYNKIKNIYNLSSNTEVEANTQDNNDELIVFLKNASYGVKLEVVDYTSSDENASENFVKTVKAIVSYKNRGNTETIELSTVIR